MQGFSPKLPLLHDKTGDGLYGLNKTLSDTVKQNLKMLILTNPGERIMDSNFGVGIRRFIFEQDTDQLRQKLSTRITEQITKYLNYVVISDIIISPPNSNDENLLFLKIIYYVPAINIKDTLNITA